MYGLAGIARQGALAAAVALGLGGLLAVRPPVPGSDPGELRQAVARLSARVLELERERAMAALVLSRHRASICYIYAIYRMENRGAARPLRAHLSGTGFVVAEGWVATNRHVAQPWYNDLQGAALAPRGAQPRLERLLAFFPGLRSPVELTHVTVDPHSDVALAQFELPPAAAAEGALPPLPLAEAPQQLGDPVLVVGYPLGIEALIAKSPRSVSRGLLKQEDDLEAAQRLAALSLIRPSATQGHVGDVVEERLLYDASTARGASGAPVFNAHGEVVAVNTAYLDGFSGGTLGISVHALRPLLRQALAGAPSKAGSR